MILGFPGGSAVKNLPAMQETWVWSLGWEDSLEKGMANNSSILAWRTLWTEEPVGLQSMGSERVRHNWATNTYMWFLGTLFNIHTQRHIHAHDILPRCHILSFLPCSRIFYGFSSSLKPKQILRSCKKHSKTDRPAIKNFSVPAF